MFEIGRVCTKIAGREAGHICVVVDILDNGFLLIDGNVKRRKCNPGHLEPMAQLLELKKGASTHEVKEALKHAGLLAEHKAPEVAKKRERKGSEKPKKGTKAKEEKKKLAKKKKGSKTEAEMVEESLAKV